MQTQLLRCLGFFFFPFFFLAHTTHLEMQSVALSAIGENIYLPPALSEREYQHHQVWNKGRHHVVISNFRAFISAQCHPAAGLVNY